MQLRHARIGMALVGLVALGCDNKPGEIRVLNEYTGTCPLYFKTSEFRGIGWATTPLLAGENLLPPLRPGLIRVDFRTEGIACGPEPCSLGPAGFEYSCALFTGARVPGSIVVRNSSGACNQPLIACPNLAAYSPVDAGGPTENRPDAALPPTTGNWIVSQATPTSGNGAVEIATVEIVTAPGGDTTLRRIIASGLVGTTRHILKADIVVATGVVSTISHSFTPADGVDAGLALCAPTAPWPPCVGATYTTARKTLTLVGTALGNPVPANGVSTIDAILIHP